MALETEQKKEVVHLPEKFSGRKVGEVLLEVHALRDRGITGLVADFSGTAFMDSSGIGVLVSLTKEFKSRGIAFSLRGLNDEIRDLFSDTGLDMIFTIETPDGVSEAEVDIFENGGVDIKLDIDEESDGDVCIFHMSGVMTHPAGSRYFKQQFLLALVKHRKILLDFENLTFFDSLSISVVLNMNKLLKETGGSLRICGANYIVEELFSTLNIGQIIPIFKDVPAAREDWN